MCSPVAALISGVFYVQQRSGTKKNYLSHEKQFHSEKIFRVQGKVLQHPEMSVYIPAQVGPVFWLHVYICLQARVCLTYERRVTLRTISYCGCSRRTQTSVWRMHDIVTLLTPVAESMYVTAGLSQNNTGQSFSVNRRVTWSLNASYPDMLDKHAAPYCLEKNTEQSRRGSAVTPSFPFVYAHLAPPVWRRAQG